MANKIIVDAGHNGLTDPGAVYNGRRESDDVLRLAEAVGSILMRNGYDIEYTRTGDISQSVVQKAQLANNAGADLFVSLHRNMGTYPGQYEGVQTLIYDHSGIKQQMAENINSNLEGVGFRNINVETRPDLAVLRRTQMPALLVEVGFIDSEKDNQLFDTRFDEIAQAIADGIMDTLNDAGADPDTGIPMSYAYQAPLQPAPTVPSFQMNPAQSMSWTAFRTESDSPVMGGMQNMADLQNSQNSANTENTRPLYRVQVGAFHNLQNAIELEQELKRLGYNTWIVTA